MRSTTPLLLGALLALPALSRAEPPPDRPKPARVEDADGVVARVTRAFGQLRGYQVAASCQGGLARGADHRIGTQTVNESWQAAVAGLVCRVDAPQAFRQRAGQGGALLSGGRWVSMLSTDEGRKLERLFQRPEDVLAECARLKRLARWVEPEPGAPAPAPAGAPVAAPDDDDTDDGTQARGGGGDDSSAEAPPAPSSHHIRIVGPATAALEHFTRIINSGCFAEG